MNPLSEAEQLLRLRAGEVQIVRIWFENNLADEEEYEAAIKELHDARAAYRAELEKSKEAK